MQSELENLRRLLEMALPFVESQQQAERMLDGFRKPAPKRPIDEFVEQIKDAINHPRPQPTHSSAA